MNRSPSVLAVLALALAGCAQDPTGVAPSTRAPSLPLGAPLNRPAFSHIDFGNGRWTVTTVLPWEEMGVGAAAAINNAGVAVGRQTGRAYRMMPGGAAALLDGGGNPRAINDAGDAAGFASTAAGQSAVLWPAGGGRVDLSARPGAGPGAAADVNENGQVVGRASGRAVLWQTDGSVVRVADVANATESEAAAVNNRGTVVGFVRLGTQGERRAFLWTPDGGTRFLATPAGGRSAALGINDAGQIVGWVQEGGIADIRPAVWSSPEAFTVLSSGSTFATQASAINDHGVIVGSSSRQAVVWTSAQAEPITIARVACPTAGSEQVCRAVMSASAGAINDKAQIAGGVFQEYHDGRHIETENGVVWAFNPNTPTPTTTTLVAQHASRCLDIPGWTRDWGAQLILWDCHGGENQQFSYPAVGQTGEIRVYGGSLCIDAASGQGNNGDPIIIWGCHGGANQQWTRLSTGELRGINGRCLDVGGWSADNGAQLILWDCHGGANQRFAPGSSTTMLASAARLSPARAPLIVARP